MRQHRGDESISPSRPPIPITPTKKNTPGRPTITGAVAMTPNTLRNRKKYLMKQKRRTERRRVLGQSSQNVSIEDSAESSQNVVIEGSSESSESENEIMGNEHLDDSNQAKSANALKKAVYRKKCQLRGILSANPYDNMRLLVWFNYDSKIHPGLQGCHNLVDIISRSDRKIPYQKLRLKELFKNMALEVK